MADPPDAKKNISLILVAVAIGVLYFAATELMDDDDETSSDPETTEQSDEGSSDEGSSDEDETDDTPELSDSERRGQRETGTITTEHYVAEIDNLGGGVSSFLLVGDERFTNEDGTSINIITTDTDRWPRYQSLRVDLGQIGIPESAVWDLTQVSDTEVRLTWEGEGIRVTRSLLAGRGPYQLWHTVRVENTAHYERTTRLEMETWHWILRDDESSGIIAMASRSPYISSGACVYGEETERKLRDDLTEDGPHGYGNGDVHIAATENVYFTQSMAASEPIAARCALTAVDLPNAANPIGTLFHARLIYPWETIEPGGSRTYRTLAYMGPKDRPSLTLAGHELPLMIDMGFFAAIANQLTRLLSFIHDYVPNWGLAIILLTLLIRSLLFPVTNLSFKSMAKMRRLKPEIDRINELYKDDAEKKGAATMELWRKHKVNPAAGCLPMIVQLPVFWALYASLSTNIELFHMPFALWWTDLSSPDTYYVLPILLGALMHLQQRLSPTTMDPAQAKMMLYFMPVMITAFMLFLPSGLCLYMLTSSALGIGQMKLNEYRLEKELENAPPLESVAGESPSRVPGSADENLSAKPQKRRPRRKRRVRRGRA